jgi:cell division protein FtsW
VTAIHDLGATGRCRELDWMMLAVAALCCLGLTMAVSVQPLVTEGGTALDALRSHGARLCAGLVAFLVASAVPLHLLHPGYSAAPMTSPAARWFGPFDRAAWVFCAALLLTAAPIVVADDINGAHRWLRLGALTGQPIDVARLVLVILLAGRIAVSQALGDVRGLVGLCRMMVGPALLVLVLLGQPDKGNAALTVLLASGIAFAGGASLRWFLLLGAPAGLAIGYHFLSEDYSTHRILSWWTGEHPDQVQAGLLALQSGGVVGQGLGAGWLKAGFVPEARNDFVFTIVGEELGLLGTAAVVLLYALMLACGTRLATRIRDPFFRYVVFGCTMAVGLQAAMNLAVTTGLAPSKGIDLPFVSAGGSCLVASLAAIGLIGNAARRDAAMS